MIHDIHGDKHTLTVEVKTRVALDKIAVAEFITQKYNHKTIYCNYGDDKCAQRMKMPNVVQYLPNIDF